MKKKISIFLGLLISFLLIIFVVYPLFGQAATFWPSSPEVMDITETAARVEAVANCGSNPGCTRWGFEWGTSSGNYTESSWPGGTPRPGNKFFYRVLTNLSPGTEYYFRAGVRDENGWAFSREVSFTTASPASWSWLACEEHNVWGWAWSSNIGWISFSCINTLAKGTGIDYGVDICESEIDPRCDGVAAPKTGKFIGGAWSRGTDTHIGGVGWISFNRSETGAPPRDDPCPDGSCIAKLDFDTGEVSGWARAAIVEEKLYESYIIDHDAQSLSGDSLSGLKWQGQTFTVSTEMHRATRISLFLYNASVLKERLIVSIRTSTANPTDWCRGEIDIDPGSGGEPEWYDIDLEDVPADGCILSPSTQYLIAVRCPDCSGNISWKSYMLGTYLGGRDYESNDGGVFWTIDSGPTGEDFRFKIWGVSPGGSGGWDGWIKLRGIVQGGGTYGVSLNSVPTPSEFEGWAWGGDDTPGEAVIGWISFNRLNCDTDGDGFSNGIGNCPAAGTRITNHKVMTSINLNRPPSAAISCNPSCTIYETDVLVLENNSTDLENNIVQSEWSTKVQGAGDSTYLVRNTCMVDPLCDFAPQNWLGRGNYTARLIVEDAGSLSDTATINFSILRDITAGFMCSLDDVIWEVCGNVTPMDGEIVYFKDDSSLLEYSRASEGAAITSRLWEKDGAVFDLDNNTNPSITATLPSMLIKLTVTDSAGSAGRSASVSHTIGVAMPLPTWKEISPF